MMFNVSDEEMAAILARFEEKGEGYPELIEPVRREHLAKIADYLFDDTYSDPEPEAWEMISRGNIYSYACYLHEITELELRSTFQHRRDYHGGALFRQYSFIRDFLKLKTGEEFGIIELCYNDSWVTGEKDKSNSRILRKYIERHHPEL